jgi:rubrerythrin
MGRFNHSDTRSAQLRPTRRAAPMFAIAAALVATSVAPAQSAPAPKPSPAPPAAPAKPAPSAPTLASAQAVWNLLRVRESSASAFARKADEEGFTQIGSLLRAIERSTQAQRRQAEAALKALGAAPVAEPERRVDVRATRDNIAALQTTGATLRAQVQQAAAGARTDQQPAARKALDLLRESVAEQDRLLSLALAGLDTDAKRPREYWVSKTCGFIVERLDIKRCPNCLEPTSDFESVK